MYVFWGFSICFGSTIICLTTHVWLNCASSRHDRWQSVDQNHPYRISRVDCFDKACFRYVFGGCSIFFGSTIICLTTHVWLNCASPWHDSEQSVDRVHPYRISRVDWFDISYFRYVLGDCWLVFGFPITFLTTHVWLNCALPRNDRWQSVDRKHPLRNRRDD